MSKIATQQTEVTTAADLDMRNTSGLTRRTFVTQEEGVESNGKDDFDEMKVTPSPSALPPSAFRDVVRCVNKGGPLAFLVAVGVSFLAILKSGSELHRENTFFNFLYLYATITMLVLSIMGLMNALKLDVHHD
jgi:hypothetical protein